MHSLYEFRAEYLKALAHPIRLQILDLLREGEMSVCQIEDALNRQQAYVSGQLRNLHGARLVDCHRKGREMYYRLADPMVGDLLSLMFGPAEARGNGHLPLSSTPKMEERS